MKRQAANAYSNGDGFEDRTGTGPLSAQRLLISFEQGFVTPSLRASSLALDAWHGGDEPDYATIALRLPTGVALHIGQSADDLRAFAAACMRAADTLDGGKGKQ